MCKEDDFFVILASCRCWDDGHILNRSSGGTRYRNHCKRIQPMKLIIAIMLSVSAMTCTLAQAEDGSTRLNELHEMRQQAK